MDTLTYIPSIATRGQLTPRVLRARFGDGYVQEEGDGINAMLSTWELVYDVVQQQSGVPVTLDLLKTFFETQAGYKRFIWTQPPPFNDEGPQQWVCTEWSWSYSDGLLTSIRATIEKRPS
jgi:phage-related protein